VRRLLVLGLGLAALGGAAYAIAQGSTQQGRIGPANKVQPSGRKLTPTGKQSLTERNGARAANARFSAKLPLDHTDRSPQRYLDRILWQYVHGTDSEPPPPGPNASRVDERSWKGARP
jgi:hypothetical protein